MHNMKKFLLLLFLAINIFFPVKANALSNSADAFMSLPFGHTFIRTQKRMEKSGARVITPRKDSLTMEGMFENGTTETTFEPGSNITYAQTIKLAACVHQKYTIGFITLTNGSPNWYDSYIYYAKAFEIINHDYYWDNLISRAEFVEIFANSLPNEALSEKNKIANNMIPDVSMAHPQAEFIYKMYRTGILTGVNEEGTFLPNNYIKRSEVAAILTRMIDKNTRKSFTLNTNSNSNENNTTTYIVNFNSTGGSAVKEQKVKEGELAIWPSGPIKEGYQFAGWYLDSHLTKYYNFDEPVTSDITLYTKWLKK